MEFVKFGFCILVATLIVGASVAVMAPTMVKAKSGLEIIVKDKIENKY